MVRSKLRVLVAAEYPAVRQLLLDVVREEPGAIVVGEAENSGRAIALAKTLRPDVALVDCYLPQAQGIDFNRLSRIAGLDTAWVIAEETRNTQAVVLVNLNEAVLQDGALTVASKACFHKEEGANTVAFTLRELYQESLLPASPVLANVQVEEGAPVRPKLAAVAEDVLSVSGLTLIGGLCLIATFVLAPIGAVVALAGLGGLLVSLAMRAVASVWPKHFLHSQVPSASKSVTHDLGQESVLVLGTGEGWKNGNGNKSNEREYRYKSSV